MGNAFIKGLSHSADNQIHVVEPISSVKAKLKDDFGVVVSNYDDPEKQMGEIVTLCDYVLICVKPQVFNKIKETLKNLLSDNQIVISIMAGISTENLCKGLGIKNAIRVMPNTPCLVGSGASALCSSKETKEDDMSLALKLFSSVGIVEEVPEILMDAVTGLSGSGPAYVFQFIEALSDAGVRVGLTREQSLKLAAQTVYGSSRLLLETGEHPGKLKDMVTSPGGTTIAGIHALEKGGIRSTVIDAVNWSEEPHPDLVQVLTVTVEPDELTLTCPATKLPLEATALFAVL